MPPSSASCLLAYTQCALSIFKFLFDFNLIFFLSVCVCCSSAVKGSSDGMKGRGGGGG